MSLMFGHDHLAEFQMPFPLQSALTVPAFVFHFQDRYAVAQSTPDLSDGRFHSCHPWQ